MGGNRKLLILMVILSNAVFGSGSFGFVTDQDASVVIGQVDFTSSGYSCSDSTLCDPRSIYVDSLKRLYIADYGNNRVLIYDSIPVTNNAHADAVVGQVDMNSNAASVSDSTFNQPMSVFSDGKGLFIADFLNHRVLIYNTIPTSNNAHADVVVGQVDMNSNTQGCSDSTLCLPVGVFSDGTRLFIADCFNHRVLIYNTIPSTNNAHADIVIGQVDMNSNFSSVSDSTLAWPHSVVLHNGKLFITDCSNNRVLIYNTIPTANNAHADVVIGQLDMNSNGSSVTDSTLSAPVGIYLEDSIIYITDAGNHRILIYSPIPTSNNAHVDIVLGQADMNSGAYNQGGGVSANTLYLPCGIFFDDKKLFVADAYNNRCLIYYSDTTDVEEETQDFNFKSQSSLRIDPNPFHCLTTISYWLADDDCITLKIYNITGKLVRILIHQHRMKRGKHKIFWNGTNNESKKVPSGIYFCRSETATSITTKKLILLR